MDGHPRTWHHGLVAEWWAAFNGDFRGHEIDYYREQVAASGGPVLDAGCGAGRVLVPLLDDGLDVDGCDQSADMIAACGRLAAAAGHAPRLEVQPLHELDMGRRYRTIIVVGTFGLGSSRALDVEAVARLAAHLEPSGTLLVDIEVPWTDVDVWSRFVPTARRELPEEWSEPQRRQDAAGAEYRLATRLFDLDPLDQRVTFEVHLERWRDGELEAEEQRQLDLTAYLPRELQLLLEQAGLEVTAVHGEHEPRPATPDDAFVTLLARRRP